MAIRLERSDAVATVVMDRPEARNAVDGPAARALTDALGTERGLRVAADGDGPMGPTRLALTKPTIAAVEGHAVAGGLMIRTGRPVDAREALAFGLANRVVPPGRAREEGARRFAAGAGRHGQF
jgi:enoyl-CoA hydratase